MEFRLVFAAITSGTIFLAVCPGTHGQQEVVSDVHFTPLDTTSVYVAGSNMTFGCLANGGSPQPLMKWWVGTEPVKHATQRQHRAKNYVRATLQVTIYREMNGKNLTCEADNDVGRPLKTSKLMVVKYPPYVTVSYDHTDKTVVCTASGNPNTFEFKGWQRGLDDGDMASLKSSTSLADASWGLPLSGDIYNDIGYYRCTVSNDLGERSSVALIQPWCAPKFLDAISNYTAYEESNMTINFNVYSSPPVVQFKWIKEGVVLTSTFWNAAPQFSFTNLTLLVRGSPMVVQGQTVKMDVTNVTLEMAGNYSLVLTTERGDYNQLDFSINVLIDEITTPPGGPTILEAGGLKTGMIILIVAIAVNVVVCLGIIYWRSRKISRRNEKSKIHGRSRETSKFLPAVRDNVSSMPPTPPRRTTSVGRVRPKAKEFGGPGHYAELDFGHIKENRGNNAVTRKEPPTEYAWIDFSRSPCSPGAS